MSAVSEYTKWWGGDGTLAPSEVALGLRLAAAAIAELEANLTHEQESNHISIEQWGIWGKRAEQAEAELAMAYENADFDEPLTFDEYRADLHEQAAARAKYGAERGLYDRH